MSDQRTNSVSLRNEGRAWARIGCRQRAAAFSNSGRLSVLSSKIASVSERPKAHVITSRWLPGVTFFALLLIGQRYSYGLRELMISLYQIFYIHGCEFRRLSQRSHQCAYSWIGHN